MNPIKRAALKFYSKVTGNTLYDPDYIDFLVKTYDEIERQENGMWDEIDPDWSDEFNEDEE